MEDLEKAKGLEKSVLKVFDKYRNRTNKGSESEALELLSQLSNPAEVRDDTKHHYTLLHHACYNGWYEVSKVLIEKYSCDPNSKSFAGSIPLCHACWGGNLDLVKYLIFDKGCDPNDCNNLGQVPLHYAARGGCLDIMKFLIEHCKVDSAFKDRKACIPLHYACASGHITIATYLVEVQQQNPDSRDENNQTPLHSACEMGHLLVAKYLIKKHNCDAACKRNGGQTPLHLACERGHLNVAKYLIKEQHIKPSIKTDSSRTPLHTTCLNGHLDMAKYLIEEQQCDPACSDTKGWMPLHFACEGGYLNIVEYLIERQACNPACKNHNGQTPLHSACLKGHLHLAKYLIEKHKCDPACKRNDGNTPLHLACERGHLNVAKYLIEEQHIDPSYKSADNNWTPLHSACKNGCLNIAKYLIEECYCDPKHRTGDGYSPLSLACKSHQLDFVMYLVNKCNCNLINCNIQLSHYFVKTYTDIALFLISSCEVNDPNTDLKDLLLYPAFKVFVMGNFSSGKSTLVKAIQEHFQDQPNFAQKILRYYQQVSEVELCTAGITFINMQVPNCGRVIMYDFAGQAEYYSSHAAICENLMASEGCLIIVLFNLSKVHNECVQELQFWQLFINNQLRSCVHYPPIIFVASHADIVKSQGLDPAHKAKQVMLTSFGVKSGHEVVFSDCRQKYSPGLDVISEKIVKLGAKYQETNTVDTKVHLLLYFLRHHLENKTAYLLDEVFQLITDFRKMEFLHQNGQLPENIDELLGLMINLHTSGEVLLLKKENDIGKSWVILEKDALFSDINGTIFAPEKFKNYHEISNSTGVVPLLNIRRFFPQHDPQMLIGFMMHLELCHEISTPEAILIDKEGSCRAIDSAQNSESFYFFPALVKVESPSKAFFNQITHYKYGWCLQRVHGHQCLTSRFLHTLLLRLAFTFALRCEQEVHSIVLQRECNIWKSGIHWVNKDGVEIIVEVVEQSTAVVAVFGCTDRNIMKCIQLRSAIIHMILSTVKQFCGAVELKEYLIHPEELTSYPFRNISDLFRYSMNRLALTIMEQKEVITVKVGEHFKTIEIDKLLYFEPYSCLSDKLMAFLHSCIDDLNQPIPDSFLLDFATLAYLKQSKLKEILPLNESELAGAVAQCDEQYKVDQRHQCFLLLRTWRDSNENTTYNGLRKLLDSFSIFCGRNPLNFASDVPHSV